MVCPIQDEDLKTKGIGIGNRLINIFLRLFTGFKKCIRILYISAYFAMPLTTEKMLHVVIDVVKDAHVTSFLLSKA